MMIFDPRDDMGGGDIRKSNHRMRTDERIARRPTGSGYDEWGGSVRNINETYRLDNYQSPNPLSPSFTNENPSPDSSDYRDAGHVAKVGTNVYTVATPNMERLTSAPSRANRPWRNPAGVPRRGK